MAQLVAGTVGAVAGFFIGGPTGAMVGFNVGASLYGAINGAETNVQGAKIGDISKQTSEEGIPCPIVWGRVRPIGGNLIATSDPRIIKTTTTQSSGKGGGGGKTKTTTEHVHRDYAIRICEGPVEVIRAWRNNELVYDARQIVLLGEDENDAFLEYGLFYDGSWDQMPDPTLESIYGAGNVPAHRGICYMVCRNELLDDTSGAVPSWLFEVERSEGKLSTSRPYDIENIEISSSSGVISVRESPNNSSVHSAVSSGASISSIALTRVMFWVYHTQDPEVASSNGAEIISAQLIYNPTVIVQSSQTESLNSNGSSIIDASLSLARLEYNIPKDDVSSYGATITQVSLS